jgi:hypothetical protein
MRLLNKRLCGVRKETFARGLIETKTTINSIALPLLQIDKLTGTLTRLNVQITRCNHQGTMSQRLHNQIYPRTII